MIHFGHFLVLDTPKESIIQSNGRTLNYLLQIELAMVTSDHFHGFDGKAVFLQEIDIAEGLWLYSLY